MSNATSRHALMPNPAPPASTLQTRTDVESHVWVQRLSTDGPARDQALSDLRELLLRAARFEINRRRVASPHRDSDLDDLAQQSADDSLVAVLSKLGDFHSQSRFTTWAYKFALSDTAAKIRRLSWQGRALRLEPEGWPRIADGDSTPHQGVETTGLLPVLRQAIQTDLSARSLPPSHSTTSPSTCSPSG